MSTKSRALMNKLYSATEAIPQQFDTLLSSMNNFNLKNSIHYRAEDDSSDNEEDDNDNYNNEEEDDYYYNGEPEPEPEPEVVREISVTMKRMSDGKLELELNFSDQLQSISMSATLSRSNEIVQLDSSGICTSTLNTEPWRL